jgi:hypothetical protein
MQGIARRWRRRRWPLDIELLINYPWADKEDRAGGVRAETGWSRRFDDAIVLPDGRKLVTLLDAGVHKTVTLILRLRICARGGPKCCRV